MIDHTPLGKASDYPTQYDPHQLAPLPRALGREVLELSGNLPFTGEDVWTAYELSWLDARGKPIVAIGEFRFPCTSPHLIESKSLKLYLNSLNQERFDSRAQLVQVLQKDLSKAAGESVSVTLFTLTEYRKQGLTALPGTCIDDLETDIDAYHPDSTLLALKPADAMVEETLYSHLLRSLCPVTGQPDWATLVVQYQGAALCPESLLRYVVSYRQHQDFHEQCVERIFRDISTHCQPHRLSVHARYTRRGGLDINPWRSTDRAVAPAWRFERQ